MRRTPDYAMQFINFLLQPDVMAAITNKVRYPNAVPASLPMVEADVKDNPNVFPAAAAQLARAFTAKAPTPGGGAGAHAHVGAVQGRFLTAGLAAVEITGLTVRYGPVVALDRLDLQIGSGEMFVLLGGSGSGKTTLLRALGGFIQPSAGRIVLGGQDITRLPPHRRPVNTTFQSYALFPHMTVADNVAFGLRRQGVARAEIAAPGGRAARAGAAGRLRRAQAGRALRRPAAARGAGPRARAAAAAAAAGRADVRARPRPARADPAGTAARAAADRHHLRAGHARPGRGAGDGDRIGLLHDGRLAQVGTPAELYERPASRYVAGFMGNDNVLPARRASRRGRRPCSRSTGSARPRPAAPAPPDAGLGGAAAGTPAHRAGRPAGRQPGLRHGGRERVFRRLRRLRRPRCQRRRRCR